MLETPKASPRATSPCPSDENLGEQLAASCARLEKRLAQIGAAVDEALRKPGPRAVLTMHGPEPAWLVELRARYRDARQVDAAVVVVPRDAVAVVLDLIDDARFHK